MEKALRELMDALATAYVSLEKVDLKKSIDENVDVTGLPERPVKAYMMGLDVLGEG